MNRDYYVETEREVIRANGIEFFLERFHFDKDCSRRDQLKPHIHSAVEMLFVVEGSFLFYADGKEFLANEGDMILFRSNVIHSARGVRPGEAKYYVLKIKPSLLMEMSFEKNTAEYLLQFAFAKPQDPCFWTKEQLDEMGVSRCFEDFLRESRDMSYAYDVLLKASAVSILAYLMRSTSRYRLPAGEEIGKNVARGIYDAVVYINSGYSQELTAMDCAKIANMSYSHFSRCFRTVTGCGFREYLNGIRIKRSQKALLESDDSITDVAMKCGYDNVSYFISVFRAATGYTPYAYRKKMLMEE